jgi:hypothetical protein
MKKIVFGQVFIEGGHKAITRATVYRPNRSDAGYASVVDEGMGEAFGPSKQGASLNAFTAVQNN